MTVDVSSAFKLTNVNPFDINGEVKTLASTLTTLKSNAEDIFTVHKHANNKHDHPDDPNLNSYDPSVNKLGAPLHIAEMYQFFVWWIQ